MEKLTTTVYCRRIYPKHKEKEEAKGFRLRGPFMHKKSELAKNYKKMNIS